MSKIPFTFKALILTVFLSSLPISANPMKQVKQVNPVPMFMPILFNKSKELSLTPEQISAFDKWRSENMAPAVQATNTIIEGEKAIEKAVLEGSTASKINTILNNMAKARADLTSRTLRCHAHTKQILNEVQWTKLLKMYAKQNS